MHTATFHDFLVDYVNFANNGALRSCSYWRNRTLRSVPRLRLQQRRTLPRVVPANATPATTRRVLAYHGAEFDTTDWAFYIQDDWRWSPRLTVNLGLRYELELLPDAQFANPIFPQTSLLPNDKNNFGPRGGFAYDLTGDGKTSVRGGMGLYYGRLINSTISNAITNTGIDRSQFQLSLAATAAGAPIFPNVVPAPAAIANPTGAHIPGSSIVVLEPDLHLPMIFQGDFIVEREIARNTLVSASYITSRGRFLPTFINKNSGPATGFQTLTVTSGEFAGQSVTVPVYTVTY